MENIEGLGATFILDNNKDDKMEINKKFVDMFSAVIEIPGYKDAKGNLDKAELKELLMTRGAAVVAKMGKEFASTSSLIKLIQEEGVFAPLEDDRVIKYVGLSSDTPIEMDEVYKAVGTPIDIYQGENPVNTTCILTGLSYPYTVLDTIRQRVEGSQDTAKRNIQATSKARLDDNIDFLSETAESITPSGTTGSTKDDIFAKYRKAQ